MPNSRRQEVTTHKNINRTLSSPQFSCRWQCGLENPLAFLETKVIPQTPQTLHMSITVPTAFKKGKNCPENTFISRFNNSELKCPRRF